MGMGKGWAWCGVEGWEGGGEEDGSGRGRGGYGTHGEGEAGYMQIISCCHHVLAMPTGFGRAPVMKGPPLI